MSVPKKRPQPGPGAPLTAERQQYRRLMAQGLNDPQVCLQIGVHPTTGSRWREGHNRVDNTGETRYYPPIHTEPKAISPRYPSEKERTLIGDLLAASHTQRSVAAQLRRSPSTISREVRRNISGAGNYRPFGAPQTGPRQRGAGFVQAKLEQRWSPQQTATHCRSSSRPTPTATCCREASTGPSTCREAARYAARWRGRCVPDRPGVSRTAAAMSPGRAASSIHR